MLCVLYIIGRRYMHSGGTGNFLDITSVLRILGHSEKQKRREAQSSSGNSGGNKVQNGGTMRG
jgi:hypothetical protein